MYGQSYNHGQPKLSVVSPAVITGLPREQREGKSRLDVRRGRQGRGGGKFALLLLPWLERGFEYRKVLSGRARPQVGKLSQ
jgi:hypothetical protein